MRNQNLFNALQDICGFTAVGDEMDAIIKAVMKDIMILEDEAVIEHE